jgi:hypothetical protein
VLVVARVVVIPVAVPVMVMVAVVIPVMVAVALAVPVMVMVAVVIPVMVAVALAVPVMVMVAVVIPVMVAVALAVPVMVMVAVVIPVMVAVVIPVMVPVVIPVVIPVAAPVAVPVAAPSITLWIWVGLVVILGADAQKLGQHLRDRVVVQILALGFPGLAMAPVHRLLPGQFPDRGVSLDHAGQSSAEAVHVFVDVGEAMPYLAQMATRDEHGRIEMRRVPRAVRGRHGDRLDLIP